jgi:hypothetical protein
MKKEVFASILGSRSLQMRRRRQLDPYGEEDTRSPTQDDNPSDVVNCSDNVKV